MPRKQECADHALWQTNLRVAFWLMIVLTYYLLLFTNSTLGMWLAMIASFALFFTRRGLDRKHAEWHLGQNADK